jgi:DNA-binding MarR family transcriptional regulator
MHNHTLCAAITRLARNIHNRTTENLTWLGLNYGQLAVLRIIREEPGLRQRDICLILGVNKSVVSRAVKALTLAGFVTLRRDPQWHGRLGLVPTRQDRALRDRQEKSCGETEDRLLAEFSPEEIEQFRRFLRRATLLLNCQPRLPAWNQASAGAPPVPPSPLPWMDF